MKWGDFRASKRWCSFACVIIRVMSIGNFLLSYCHMKPRLIYGCVGGHQAVTSARCRLGQVARRTSLVLWLQKSQHPRIAPVLLFRVRARVQEQRTRCIAQSAGGICLQAGEADGNRSEALSVCLWAARNFPDDTFDKGNMANCMSERIRLITGLLLCTFFHLRQSTNCAARTGKYR